MIRWFVVAVCVWLGTTWEMAEARANPTEASVTPYDLIAGVVPVGAGEATADISGTDCKLTKNAAGDGFTIEKDKCVDLRHLGAAGIKVGTLKVKLAEPEPEKGGTYTLTEGKNTAGLDAEVELESVAVPGGLGSIEVPVVEKKVGRDEALALLKKSPESIWAKTKDKKVILLHLTASAAPAGVRAGQPTPPAGGGSPPAATTPPRRRSRLARAADLAWCAAPPSMANDYLVCVDATGGRMNTVSVGAKNHVILPNRSLVVVVRHPAGRSVEITMAGTRGLYEPTVANYTGDYLKDGRGPNQQVEDKALPPVITIGSFAPRTPGNADVHVELLFGEVVEAETTIELIVQATYAGAIRLGLATIGGGAVDRAYEAQLAPGSTQPEVAVTSTGDVNIELTVGISAYVVDLLVDGGRIYVDRPVWSYFVPSPYIGVGVIAPDTSGGVTYVPSLHIGAEWELSKSFAVSATGVARRVTRLSPGLEVGSPVGAMTELTEERYEWGFAFVFSLSPEFLELAVGKP